MIKIPRNRLSRARRRVIIITVAIVVAIIIVLGLLATFYTEVLWFDETGYQKVFWKSVATRIELGAVFGVLFAALMLLNLWIVRKITNPARMFSVPDQILERYRATLQPYMKWGVIIAAIVFGLFAGSGATVKWQQYLLFRHPTKFHSVDPVFHKDLGFYVFKLPFERFVFTWLFSSLVIITLIVAAAHYFMGGIRPQQRGERVAPEVRAHLSVLFGLIVLLKAWGYRLDQFNLLYSSRGQVTGASYTDVHAQLPALKLLMIIAIVISVLFFVNARFKNWLLPLGGIGLLILTSIVAGGIWPAAVQRLSVTPNERIKESPYIKRNIVATRLAFGLEGTQVIPYSGLQDLSATAVQANQATIQNVRLWDPGVLINQYVSLQRIKQYYEFFGSADIDRYRFASGERQVMLAAREIFPSGLSPGAQTWLNTHLVYTHGYGVVASRVDRVTAEGQADFIIQNIPPVSSDGGPTITEPRIYYGEQQQTAFVVVDTKQQELDYPRGTSYQPYTYDGTGGVKLSNFFKRLAFAWRFRDVNLLISSAITPDSRIMFRRTITDRINRALPFITLDGDPYIAVVDGRLQWIVDGYTSTSMYPYSQRINFNATSNGLVVGSGNYIRNSVKVTVDAKNGTVTAYAWDPTDPILQSWMKVFPGLIKPKSAMSQALLQHVRYPEGLFSLQTDRYATYHITDPGDFYAKEDAWSVANDPTAAANNLGSQPPVPPYYVLMKLPGSTGSTGLDFALVRPFTPNNRQNMTAYMVAHSDPGDYGQLVTYRFPNSDALFGPQQIQGRINQDPLVSQQISLWNQQNSKVTYGNLLVIPMNGSLLYVQPLYLTGQGATFPELKRVVAVSGGDVKMGDTLTQALNAIFGIAAPSAIEGTAPNGKSVRDLIADAIAADQRAQDDLRNGDFAAYGRDIAAMRKALDDAAKAAGAAPQPSPSPS